MVGKKKRSGTPRGIWFNDREWPLVEAYLKANKMSLTQLAKPLILDHVLDGGEGPVLEALSDIQRELASDEPNVLRPETQVKLLRSAMLGHRMMREVLAAVLGDAQKADALYLAHYERVQHRLDEAGYAGILLDAENGA